MNGKKEIAKGRIKEATGVITGNDKLRKSGRTDQSIGRIKETAGKAIDKIEKKMRG